MELRWWIIKISRGNKKNTYNLTLGIIPDKAFEDPILVTKNQVAELAKRLCGSPHCAAKKLKNKSFARTGVKPRIDLERALS